MTCAGKVNPLIDETHKCGASLINNEIVGSVGHTSGQRRIAKLQASFYASHLLIGGLGARNSSMNFTYLMAVPVSTRRPRVSTFRGSLLISQNVEGCAGD